MSARAAERTAAVRQLTPGDGADPRALRDCFGAFLTGVTVVTARTESGEPTGFTANSFTSVSLAPPLVLVCVANEARSRRVLAAARRFGVSILGDAQRDVSNAFVSRSAERFAGIDTFGEADGPPLIAGSLANLDCQRESLVEAGDHTIVIGRVLGFRREEGRPLGYFAGGYVSFALGTDALERQGGEAILAGCVLTWRDRALLLRRAGRTVWELPATPLRHGEDHRTALPRLLERLGVEAGLAAPFSVFQEPGEPQTRLIFRGEITRPPAGPVLPDGTELALFSETDVPWDALPGPAQAQVLRRFFREREAARFGIYWDTHDGGRVVAVAGSPRTWSRDTNGSDTNG